LTSSESDFGSPLIQDTGKEQNKGGSKKIEESKVSGLKTSLQTNKQTNKVLYEKIENVKRANSRKQALYSRRKEEIKDMIQKPEPVVLPMNKARKYEKENHEHQLAEEIGQSNQVSKFIEENPKPKRSYANYDNKNFEQHLVKKIRPSSQDLKIREAKPKPKRSYSNVQFYKHRMPNIISTTPPTEQPRNTEQIIEVKPNPTRNYSNDMFYEHGKPNIISMKPPREQPRNTKNIIEVKPKPKRSYSNDQFYKHVTPNIISTKPATEQPRKTNKAVITFNDKRREGKEIFQTDFFNEKHFQTQSFTIPSFMKEGFEDMPPWMFRI